MNIPPPDGSRDPRTEDPTNIWVVHLIGRVLLPGAIRLGISANAVSVAGLVAGAFAATFYLDWQRPAFAIAGFLCSVAWLILDGLDGMIARATGTASALGRFLDGLCDHGVFVLLYLALAISIDTQAAWVLASFAGAAHALQSTLYEGERMRFHRRIRGQALAAAGPPSANPLVRAYDRLAGAFDRLAEPCERRLALAPDPLGFGRHYGMRAWPPLKLMALLSNNMRVILIFATALAGDASWFWWIELGPLSLIALIGIVWHRRVEAALVAEDFGQSRRKAA